MRHRLALGLVFVLFCGFTIAPAQKKDCKGDIAGCEGDIASERSIFALVKRNLSKSSVRAQHVTSKCVSAKCGLKKAAASSPPANLSAEARRLINLGNQHIEKAKYQEAVTAFQKSARLKASAGAFVGLGDAYSELKQDKQALQAYESAVKINPQLDSVHFNIGVINYEQKAYSKAYDSLMRATQLGSPDSEELYYLGISLRALARNDEAIAALKRSVQLNPDNAEGHFELGVLHYNKKEYAEALKSYEAAVRQMPENPLLLQYLGDTMFALNSDAGAISYFEAAMKVKPELGNDADFLYYLGFAHLRADKFDEAVRILTLSTRSNPKSAKGFKGLASAQMQSPKPNYDVAITALNTSLSLDPQQSDAFVMLSQAYMFKTPPDIDESLKAGRRAAEIAPNDAIIHFLLGSAMIQYAIIEPSSETKSIEQATLSLQEAVRLKPDFSYSHGQLCLAYLFGKKQQQALSECQEAVKLSVKADEKALAHISLANVYVIMKRYDEGIKEARYALNLDPTAFHAHNVIALSYYERKKYDKAIASYKEAIRLNPQLPHTYFTLGIAYWDSGKRNDALAQYEILKKVYPQLAEQFRIYMQKNGKKK